MSTFDQNTIAYMEGRNYDMNNLKKGNRYGTEGIALGLTDLRTRLGYYTIILLIIASITFIIILCCSSTLFGYIRSEDEAKSFYKKYSKMTNSTSGIILGLSGLLFIVFVIYIVRNYNKFLKEDAALTDIGRIGLEPLSENEVHNSLTDLVANRANLNDYQRAQLRYNIGQGFRINNNNAYGNIIEDLKNKNAEYQTRGSVLRNKIRDLEAQLETAKNNEETRQRESARLAEQINELPPPSVDVFGPLNPPPLPPRNQVSGDTKQYEDEN